MALVEVDYSYKVKEWKTDIIEVDDITDEVYVEGVIRDTLLSFFDLEDEVSSIEVENIREVKQGVN